MRKSTDPNASFDAEADDVPPDGAPVVGDADAVTDTPYVAKPVRLTDEELLRDAQRQADASVREERDGERR